MADRRIFAHLVTRNEEERYLQAVLAALEPHVHTIFVYDDQSSDDTVVLAEAMGAMVSTRLPGTPAFLEDESRFRQDAWAAFRHACRPCWGDWILAVDADELLVAPCGLEAVAAAAEGKAVAVSIPIPEVFAFAGPVPMLRTDGFWGELEAPRFFTFQDAGAFRSQRLAGGSVPTYASNGVRSYETLGTTLLHLGYATLEDRTERYRRYSGRPGHSASHVNSILKPPTLVAWPGHVDVWRGRRERLA